MRAKLETSQSQMSYCHDFADPILPAEPAPSPSPSPILVQSTLLTIARHVSKQSARLTMLLNNLAELIPSWIASCCAPLTLCPVI